MKRYPLIRTRWLEEIHYNPSTGKVNVPCSCSGKYLAFRCNNKKVKVHLFAFYYMTGKWPAVQIDHEDENKLNNKWDNLQELNSSFNQIKSSTRRRSNTSGYIGVSKHKQNKNWFWHLQLNYQTKRGYGYNCPTRAALERDRYIIDKNIPYAYLNILKRSSNEERTRI